MPEAIQISRDVVRRMLKEARRDPSIESCGLLAGRNNSISAIFPARNAQLSPATSYEIAPGELFRWMKEIRAEGLDLLGIYHSHPLTENAPSPTDLARAYYPDAAYFIISPATNTHTPIRAFRIREGHANEIVVEEIS